jgi:hypothetical protein
MDGSVYSGKRSEPECSVLVLHSPWIVLFCTCTYIMPSLLCSPLIHTKSTFSSSEGPNTRAAHGEWAKDFLICWASTLVLEGIGRMGFCDISNIDEYEDFTKHGKGEYLELREG